MAHDDSTLIVETTITGKSIRYTTTNRIQVITPTLPAGLDPDELIISPAGYRLKSKIALGAEKNNSYLITASMQPSLS